MYKSYRAQKTNGNLTQAAQPFAQLAKKNGEEQFTGLSDAEIAEICKHEPHPLTQGMYVSQTNYRVKDPRKSLPFYTGVLGMRLLKQLDFTSMGFSVYFLGYEAVDDIPSDTDPQLMMWLFSRKAVLSLTHNWGSEDDDTFEISNGNTQPKGYGHIGIHVPDVNSCCQRFQSMGVTFLKEPDEGKLKGLAFIQDPDGYWIEILNSDNMARLQKMLTG